MRATPRRGALTPASQQVGRPQSDNGRHWWSRDSTPDWLSNKATGLSCVRNQGPLKRENCRTRSADDQSTRAQRAEEAGQKDQGAGASLHLQLAEEPDDPWQGIAAKARRVHPGADD